MALARKPFVVLDAEILSSSVWSQAASVRLVWITLLILCDTEGYVGAALPGIATAAGVTLEEAQDAVRVLMAPDPYSRTKKDDGRRLEEAERGYRVLNFLDHLDRLSLERKKSRDRVWRHRQRAKEREAAAVTLQPWTFSNGMSIEKETTVTPLSSQGIGKREKGVGTREKGSTDAISLPSMPVGGSAEGGIHRFERRRQLIAEFPREAKEPLADYRARIDVMLDRGRGVGRRAER